MQINGKTERIIVIGAIAIISLLAVFALIKAAAAPPGENRRLSLKKAETPRIEPLPETTRAEKEINMIFGGDIMLSRQVNSRMQKYGDYAWPFTEIASTTGTADIAVANLESPFLKGSSYTVPTGSFSFKADPKAIAGLDLAGIDVLSLANNHMLNQGKRGIEDTISLLGENQIAYCGAGRDENEARQAATVERGGKNFAFLSYAYPEDASVASTARPGIAGMDTAKMEEDVVAAKKRADAVIVLMHAGTEYTTRPNRQQEEFAKAAIEAGADMVVGHHPHWPQTYEIYKEKPIIYSLGNLVFDQMWSEETKQGLLLALTWQNGIKELRFIPIKIYDYGQPQIMTDGKEKEALLKKIGAPLDGIIYERNEEK